jgi:hypothetical protein
MNVLFNMLAILGGDVFAKFIFRLHNIFTASFGWIFLYIISNAYDFYIPLFIFYIGVPISLLAVYLFSGNVWEKNKPGAKADPITGLLNTLFKESFGRIEK